MRYPVLTTRERVVIAFAVSTITIGIRFAVMAAAGAWRDQGWHMPPAACITPLVLLPWGLTILERFHHSRDAGRGWRTSAWVALYGCLFAMLAAGIYVTLMLLDGQPLKPNIAVRFAWQQGIWGLVLLFIGDGVGGAIHGYRAALVEGERRHEVDMAEANVARQAIERRTRPDTVIGILESIASRTLADPAGAKLLLLRLARHQRMLLTRPAPPSFEDELRIVRSTVALSRPDVRLEIGHCDVTPDLGLSEPWLRTMERTLIEAPPGRYVVECERQHGSALLRLKSTEPGQAPVLASMELPLAGPQPERRQAESGGDLSLSFGSPAFTAALVIYVLASIVPDLGSLDRQPVWNLTVLTLASATLWLLVGPCVYWITAACVRLQFPLALVLTSASALLSAAAVTAASFGLLWFVTSKDEFMLAFLPLVASRNVNVALVVCTSSFAEGFSRMLIAARAGALRARQETIRAESRELESRFQPHFLFNTLASIAGLMRSNPAAAGEMCRLLARLVARTTAGAGISTWTVKDEVTLASDYLAIQRKRFADRLRIETWDVAPSAMDVAIPRLSLQPLIENIFVHAVTASCDVISLGLSIRQSRRMLTVEIWNDIADGLPTPGHGHGLAFVSNRVCDAGGKIVIAPSRDRFSVQLTIPIRKASKYPFGLAVPQRAAL